MKLPEPTESAGAATAYVPRPRSPDVDLYLDANEGARRPSITFDPERAARLAHSYPDLTRLRRVIAERLERQPDEVVVTPGADDAINRVMRAYLGPGRTLAVATPTFTMIPKYARLQGADVVELPWEDAWPEAELEDLDDVAVIAIVSPNNPTGQVVDAATVRRIAEANPGAVVLLDLAYVEYADTNPADVLTDLPNLIQVRTLSKAWGLAGLRVGYAVANPAVADRLRAVGSPYPVSAWSAEIASERLASPDATVRRHVDRVREEREALYRDLESLGARPIPSQANFVFARFEDADFVRRGLRRLGIAVRGFGGALADALRIGCPGDPDDFARLRRALRTVVAPQACLFDLDGVIADVSRSYRAAIRQTAASFGVDVTANDIAALKQKGDANDDWTVTLRLIRDRGVDTTLDEVTRRFEDLYQGGLWKEESLLCSPDWLTTVARRRPLGIVTGRPRRDAERFLETFGLGDLFGAVVSRDDVTTLKPDPEGLRRALDELKCDSAWYLGDTVDDVRAALAADVLPIGVIAPGEGDCARQALTEAGAMTVVSNAEEAL